MAHPFAQRFKMIANTGHPMLKTNQSSIIFGQTFILQQDTEELLDRIKQNIKEKKITKG
jgi:hypothetical protein